VDGDSEAYDNDSTNETGYAAGADFAPMSMPSVVSGPPLEEHLSQNTLWPEVHKLYGHGNDLFSVAADPTGSFLASASRAQSQSTAAVILWDTKSWTQVCSLESHNLTVTHLAFSPCGRFLASVGRDRKLCIHKKFPKDGSRWSFETISSIKAHARIIWGVAWTADSTHILTASRDKTVKAWKLHEQDGVAGDSKSSCLFDCESSINTISVIDNGHGHLIAAGFENGEIVFLTLSADGTLMHENCRIALWNKHAAAVRRVFWKPTNGKANNLLLASISDDHSVKIWEIR